VLLAGGAGATTELYDSVTGRFRAAAPMTVARSAHAALALDDGRVLIAGGVGGADAASTAELYDPRAGTFTALPAMKHARGRATAARLASGRVLIAGSAAPPEIFDPATSTFTDATTDTTGASGGSAVALAGGSVLLYGNEAVALYDEGAKTLTPIAGAPSLLDATWAGVALRDGRALLFGTTLIGTSSSGTTYMGSAALVDPKTSTITSFGAPGGEAVRGVLLPSGDVLAITEAATTQRWAPSTTSFVAGPTMTGTHGGHTVTLLPSGDLLVFGGASGAVDLLGGQQGGGANVAGAPLAVPHVDAGITRLLDGRVLIAGGTDFANPPNATSLAEIWSETSTTRDVATPLSEIRLGHAQALLRSGKVLIAGGASSTAELFDPSGAGGVGATTPTGSLSVARQWASATPLPDGKVLIAGGSGRSTAELYDPATGTFAPTGSMLGGHTKHGAVLLPSGRVLIADSGSAELYDPATGTFTATGAPVGARDGATATLFADGRVGMLGSTTAAIDLYDPAAGVFTLGAPIPKLVYARMMAPMLGGHALVHGGGAIPSWAPPYDTYELDPLGGGGAGTFVPVPELPQARATRPVPLLSARMLMPTGTPCIPFPPMGNDGTRTSIYDPYPAGAARPKLTTVPATAKPGDAITIAGTELVATVDGSSGSSTRHPVALWITASGQGQVVVPVTAATATSATLRIPATALRGKGFLHLVTNGVPSAGAPLEIADAPLGLGCRGDLECGTGHCVDGVCCDAACTGVCRACTAARKGSGVDGVCGDIPPGKSGTDACVLSPGAPCKADGECGTGHCVDGVCCDAACTGQCEACASRAAWASACR
jgi:hypothetical protein